jgi:hypothetical protein
LRGLDIEGRVLLKYVFMMEAKAGPGKMPLAEFYGSGNGTSLFEQGGNFTDQLRDQLLALKEFASWI